MELMPILLLSGGLLALIVGAELLVRGASRLATAAGVSSFVVGLTVVAFGTSAPELGGSLGAALKDNGELALGNVVGSNIANICLILGLTAIINPIPVKFRLVRREVIQMIGVTVLVMLLMIPDAVPRWGGGLLVAGLIAFVVRSYIAGKRDPEQAAEMAEAAKEFAGEPGKRPPVWLNVVFILVGIGLLVLGADWLVKGASDVAQMMGVSDAVIGLTLVAFGTSVPELVLSGVAALRGESDIAVGNILGSNIFNILCVVGIVALVSPHPIMVPEGMWTRDLWVMLGASLATIPILLRGARVTRVEGSILLGLYIVYVGTLYAMRGH